MLTPQIQKNIVDFAKKIVPVYALLNWTWFDLDTNDDKHVITEGDVIQILTELVLEFNPKDVDESISGGLYVRKFGEEIEFGMDIHGGFIDNESITTKPAKRKSK